MAFPLSTADEDCVLLCAVEEPALTDEESLDNDPRFGGAESDGTPLLPDATTVFKLRRAS